MAILKKTRITHVATMATLWRRFLSAAPLLFVSLTLLQINSEGVCAQESVSEYQVKAAYLFNFLKFVEWPDDAFADPLAPIVIGVVGDDPFGPSLPQVVIGKTVQGRDLVVRVYHDGENLRGAHILFISASEKKLGGILAGLRGGSVLTVADFDGFLEAGGMIQFVSENSRVRFAINADAARRGRLQMSSKLLILAKSVDGKIKESGN